MRIVHILPELQIGGVERHVIDLSNELVGRGHEVMAISAGGQMERQLDPKVLVRHLPVHKKNPLTGWFCARKIAQWVKNENWQILHAHSRVPAWIASWAGKKSGVPYIVTAHVDFGTKTPWIYAPYRGANRVICVSAAVQSAMKDCFYDNTTVIINGLKEPKERWDPENSAQNKLLFVGRLSSVKGLQDVLRAIPADVRWTLDILGDGPQRAEWQSICKERRLEDRVTFHGYSEQVEHFMATSSCLLFPSYTEGMPLTLAQAAQVGIPVLASDIRPVCEMKGNRTGLVPPGDLTLWRQALEDCLAHRKEPERFPRDCVPTLEHMVDQVADVYASVLKTPGKNSSENYQRNVE